MQWFGTEKDAKEFFVGQVLAQAVMESSPLAEDEEYMLWFSADDEEHNDELVSRFERERDPDAFEQRMSGMLRRAFARAREVDADAEAMWTDGYEVLRKGDHYLVMLLKPVLQPSTADRLRRALGRQR